MRRPWLLAIPLFTCVECVDPLDKDADPGEPELVEPEAEPPVECIARVLDFTLSSMISACEDRDCTVLSGPWHGQTEPAAYYDLRMSAECVVASTTELAKGTSRWLLDNCIGEQIPADGSLVLTWHPSEPLDLPIAVGQVVRLRYRVIGSEAGGTDHHGWALRDTAGELLAFHSAQSFMPDPWLTEPLVLEASHQDCTPTAQCGGEAFSDQITFRTTGRASTVPDGGFGVFANGSRIYDAFVFHARSGATCPGAGSTTRYELAFLAR